jgi:hypothetical protein
MTSIKVIDLDEFYHFDAYIFLFEIIYYLLLQNSVKKLSYFKDSIFWIVQKMFD